jgi:antitoxin CptB
VIPASWQYRTKCSAGGADNGAFPRYISLARHVRAFRVAERFMSGTTRSSEGLDERRRRLLFRAWHRGMREVDLVTGPFADAYIGTLSNAELDEFERLLEVPEPELLAWVMGQEPTPQSFDTPVFRKMCGLKRGAA